MGRKQTNTVEYFPHYANASDKDTLTILENYFGNDGYAFWFKILEKLCSSEGHYIDCNNSIKWQCFISKSHITLEKANTIVEKLIELGAIDAELWQYKVIWCQKFVGNIEEVYHNRKRTVPLKPTFTNINVLHNNYTKLPVETPISTPKLPVETHISTPKSTQSRVEYSKVKKSKVEKTMNPLPPTNISSSSETLNTFSLYEQEIDKLTPYITEQLKDAEGEYTPEWVCESIKIASNSNHKNLKYILAILKNCKLEGHSPQERKNGRHPKKGETKDYKSGKYGHVVQS